MKYFLDTEFFEDGKTIDLISIALVAEDGREFYAANNEAQLHRVSDWVYQNVLPHLPKLGDDLWTSRMGIRMGIEKFVGKDPAPEFWAYYADYDWVALCQLFGTMVDLPKGFPMFCMDLKQLAVMKGSPKLPKQASGEHHALADARWNRDVYAFLAAAHPAPPEAAEETEHCRHCHALAGTCVPHLCSKAEPAPPAVASGEESLDALTDIAIKASFYKDAGHPSARDSYRAVAQAVRAAVLKEAHRNLTHAEAYALRNALKSNMAVEGIVWAVVAEADAIRSRGPGGAT